MNVHAIRAIYTFEMSRTFRTIFQSIATPVITTSLYFVVFGSAIGSRMVSIDGVSYGAFIVPGLIMLTVLTESLNNASFGIYMPKFAGTIYEMLSAPVSFVEVLAGYVGAAATKSVMLGAIILVTARLFVPFEIEHPIAMILFLILTSVTFSLLGFAIGIWADSWEKTSIVPTMIVTPLTFLGGSFYSLSMLPRDLAEDHPVQPGGVPGQRLPLEFLWKIRRERGAERQHDLRVHAHLSRSHRLDVSDRLQAQELR